MRIRCRYRRLAGALVATAMAVASSLLGEGERFRVLEAGDRSYRGVTVLSVSATSLSIHHDDGLSQVPLSELSPELQHRFGYRHESAAERERALALLRERQQRESQQRLARQREERQAARLRQAEGRHSPELSAAMERFGQPPMLEKEVDLRPDFRRYGLSVRNQGPRPSCAIHSIVAALEYQYVQREGVLINISEGRLYEATRELLGGTRANSQSASEPGETSPLSDAGFTLEEVFLSIRRTGLALEGTAETLDTPQIARLQQARFAPFRLPGTTAEAVLENVVHALNARMPVVVGLAWPADSAVRHTPTLSQQAPAEGSAHAVALVGYRSADGRLESATFVFRNSWGARWGAGGYGFATYEYLKRNAFACYIVELH